MRAKVGDIITISDANRYDRPLPKGKIKGRIIRTNYGREDVYLVEFCIKNLRSRWSVGENEIIKVVAKEEKVQFT